MIATLDISKAVDEHGAEVEPEVVFDNAAFRCVFDCCQSVGMQADSERQVAEPIQGGNQTAIREGVAIVDAGDGECVDAVVKNARPQH